MPLAFYICAGIAAVLLIFVLANISSHLYDIHIDLCHIHDDLVRFYVKGQKERKPVKQREYWRDQNGFKHWRKKDA